MYMVYMRKNISNNIAKRRLLDWGQKGPSDWLSLDDNFKKQFLRLLESIRQDLSSLLWMKLYNIGHYKPRKFKHNSLNFPFRWRGCLSLRTTEFTNWIVHKQNVSCMVYLPHEGRQTNRKYSHHHWKPQLHAR